MRYAAVLFLALLCACDTSQPTFPQSQCSQTEYPDWESSAYVLPYPVGSAYGVLQGNCGGFSHTSFSSLVFSYDFAMPIGDVVTAARPGIVLDIEERYEDGDNVRGHENAVIVVHEDGTRAYYVHFTRDGALVEIGDRVVAGDTLGLSGNTGFSTEPHLHFAVYGPEEDGEFLPLPVTFRNASANPLGLRQGSFYIANPY